jgi:transposase-like protein
LQGKELQVGMKKRKARWPEEFRRRAVERMKTCDNVAALAKELGVYRCLLYKWRERFAPIDEEPAIGEATPVTLRRKLQQLKRVVVDKTLEVDFFKGALQKVEARRQRTGSSGATASTTRSRK